MRKPFWIVTLILFLCAVALGQQSSAPDIVTSSAAQSIALMNYKLWAEGQVSALWAADQQRGLDLQSEQIARQNADSVHDSSITALTNTLNTQAQQISDLQAKVTMLIGGTSPPVVTTLTFTSLPDGHLDGLFQGVNFGPPGAWCITSGELNPCIDGVPQRSLTFSQPVTITKLVWSTIDMSSPTIKLTSASGQSTIVAAVAVNMDNSVTPTWSTPTTFFTVSGTGGPAPNIHIRSVSYQ